MRLRFAVSTLMPVLVACAAMHPDPGPPIPNPFIANGAHGVDLAGLDTAVLAGDDFFGYANGAWLKSHEIPADRSSYGNSAILDEVTAKRTADLIQNADANGGGGSDARKISDTYASFLDEAGIEAKGLAPLQPALAAIAAISDHAGSGWRRISTTRPATRRSSCRAGSCSPIATSIWIRRRGCSACGRTFLSI